MSHLELVVTSGGECFIFSSCLRLTKMEQVEEGGPNLFVGLRQGLKLSTEVADNPQFLPLVSTNRQLFHFHQSFHGFEAPKLYELMATRKKLRRALWTWVRMISVRFFWRFLPVAICWGRVRCTSDSPSPSPPLSKCFAELSCFSLPLCPSFF